MPTCVVQTCETDSPSDVVCARLTRRSKTMQLRPRSLLSSTSARLRPSDETETDHSTSPSIDQSKPRAAISSLLHNLHGANSTGVGRLMFSARSTDDHNGAYRRGLLLAPPSATLLLRVGRCRIRRRWQRRVLVLLRPASSWAVARTWRRRARVSGRNRRMSTRVRARLA